MENKKKVWIVTNNFGSVKAGPAIRFLRYAPYFLENDCDIRFVTVDRGEANTENVEVDFIIANSRKSFFKKTYNKAAREKPDSIVFLSTNIFSTLNNYRMRLLGIKVIYVNTMKLSYTHRENGEKRDFARIASLKILSYFLYNSFSYVVNSTSALAENLNVNKSKLRKIYNGVDTEKYKPIPNNEKNKLKDTLGLPQNTQIFLFVGLFVQRKGILDLVEGWIQYKKQFDTNTTLLLVGNEMENAPENDSNFVENWNSLKNKAEAHENNYDIIRKPFAKNVDEFYKVADTFVFLSYLEGMPNVLLESMSTGLAVLTSQFNGFSDDYGDSEKELIILNDRKPETLINYFNKLYNNKEYKENLSTNAREHALNYFALNKSITAYLKLFS
ncbi:glycosyltransferase family 4 protein [Aureibaculum conchae]|uniref:glycosyltransferase family 4 protein n=1 Tax=Aureibaculum sp. 2308TA14-22 TaxID=3108392 RepID=UPI00339553AA